MNLEKLPTQSGKRSIKLMGRQALFAHSKARYPAMFGGYASGKTTAGCIVGIDMCIRYPGIVGAVIRNSYPELRTSTKKVFMDILDEIDRGKPEHEKVVETSNEQYNWVKFRNRSIVFFLHAQSDALYKGPEFGWFFIDQVEEMEEDMVQRITTRLRQPGYPQKGMFAGNTDQGHNWCYRWFKLGQKANAELFELNFIDNKPNLDPYYFDEMMTYPEEWKKINLYGSWDAPGGLVIEPTEEHILEPFDIPDKWPRYIAVDPAESTGVTGALGFTIDNHTNYYICHEYYRKRRLIKDHSEGIRKLWSGAERSIVADPMAWKKHEVVGGTFVTIADRYRTHGIPMIPAANDVMAALDLVRELHEPDPEHAHPITGQKPAPHLYFFRDGLPNFYEEVKSWMIEESDKEPCHLMDCLRYGILSKLVVPRFKRRRDLLRNRKTTFMSS